MRPFFLSLISFCLMYTIVKAQKVPVSDLQQSKIELSEEANSYILSVVDIIERDALHREEIDFDTLLYTIRFYADGAQTVEDTHQPIEKSLPLLRDHHSYFLTATEIKQSLGLQEKDIEKIKKGKAPNIEKSKIDSLEKTLNYATGAKLNGNIGYLNVPNFDNLYEEGMTMFADSLQNLIKQFDQQDVIGWIVDLQNNNGGNAAPMITGLGPLLDDQNGFYTVNQAGEVLSKVYYKDGGYYDLEADEGEVAPIVQSKVNYQLKDQHLPIAILTSFRTASSAEAVVANFAGQANVKIIGSKTNGLTSTNSFNFLKDNSVLNLTIGYYANRNYQVYKQGIAPDFEIEEDSAAGKNQLDDEVISKAIDWIKTTEDSR